MTDSPAPVDAYAALRVPAVRNWILGRIAWALGTQTLSTAVGWQIYEQTDSELALGLVGLVQVIPVVALALWSGQLVDRHNRRDMAMLSVTVHAICGVAMLLISLLGWPVELIYVTLFVSGIATSVGAPATSALFAQIVPTSVLVNANAWRSTSFQLAAATGPAVGGFVIAITGGATAAYALEVVCVLGFLAALATLPRPPLPPPDPAAPHGARDLGAGVRFVFRTPLLLSAITLDLFAVLFGGAVALLPVFARDILHVGPSGLGWLRAAEPAGALVMAFITTRLPPWRHAGRVLLLTVVGFGVSMIVFGLSRSFLLSWIALFFAGVFDNVSVVIRLTLEQLVVPEGLRGRVGAINHVFIGLSNQLGTFESGATAQLFGAVVSVAGGGVLSILVVAVVAWKWPELRRLGSLSDVKPAVAT